MVRKLIGINDIFSAHESQIAKLDPKKRDLFKSLSLLKSVLDTYLSQNLIHKSVQDTYELGFPVNSASVHRVIDGADSAGMVVARILDTTKWQSGVNRNGWAVDINLSALQF